MDLAEFLSVTFRHRYGQVVTIKPYVTTWEQAQNPAHPKCQGSRQSLLAYQVLPALQEQYPGTTWGFLNWEDFEIEAGPNFSGIPHPRVASQTPRTASGYPIPASAFLEDPNCTCDDEQPYHRCHSHDR